MADDAGFNLGQAGVGMQGIGGILSMIGAFGGAIAQKSSLNTQADIASINATTADRAADAALAAGQREEQRSMLATANLKGTQKAAFAANGVDLGEGSAARVLTSTDVMGDIDKNTIAANAVRSAWGYRTTATNYRSQADTTRAAAGAVSPIMAGASSLLGSAGAVAKNWYAVNKAGGGSGGTSMGYGGYTGE